VPSVNQNDQQAIDDLFQHLYRSAERAGPRDAQAEAIIQQHIRQGPPGLLYQMAQTLVGQQAALRQLRTQLDDCQRQLRQTGYPSQQGYGGYGPPYQQPLGWQRSGGGGFLAGAGQIALGVGGGILAAEALGDLLGGGGLFGGGMFGGGDWDDYGDRDDYGDQDDRDGYDDRQDAAGQDGGGQDGGDGGYDDGLNDGGFDGGVDDGGGGGFDDGGGGFDDGGGW
jgi:uncharacterized protein